MIARKFIEDLFSEQRLNPIEQAIALCKHIIVMEDDTYLIGHPEWNEIVDEAKRVLNLLRGKNKFW